MGTTRYFTVGDRLISLLADLYDARGLPITLGVAETVVFRMISVSTGVVKVDNQAATIVTRGDGVIPAQVQYDWVAADVDTAGSYAGWFIRQSGGQTEHFPTQDHGQPQFRIVFRADT